MQSMRTIMYMGSLILVVVTFGIIGVLLSDGMLWLSFRAMLELVLAGIMWLAPVALVVSGIILVASLLSRRRKAELQTDAGAADYVPDTGDASVSEDAGSTGGSRRS